MSRKNKLKKQMFTEALPEKKTPENTKEKDVKNNSSKRMAIGVVAGIFIAAAAIFIILGGPSGGNKIVEARTGVVTIPLAEVSDGKAHFYTYKGAKPINFFVLKSSDGVIRAAFDACDVCFAARKGYRQEGDTMVCNNCGQRFPSTRINEVKGGCNPAPISRNINGDYLVLKASEIEQGAFYF